MKPRTRLDTTRFVIEEVKTFYVALFDVTSAQTFENRSGEVHGSKSEPPIPVRVDVLDTIDFIEREVRELERRVRQGVLEMLPDTRRRDRRDRAAGGHHPDLRVHDSLDWLAGVLGRVYGHEDRAWAQDVESTVWRAQGRAARALGYGDRLYRLVAPCPVCDCPSLVARPDQNLVTCGNPGCRDEAGQQWKWQIGDQPPVWKETPSAEQA